MGAQIKNKTSGMLTLYSILDPILTSACIVISFILLDQELDHFLALGLQLSKSMAAGYILVLLVVFLLSLTLVSRDIATLDVLLMLIENRPDPSAVGLTYKEASSIRNNGISWRILTGGAFLVLVVQLQVWSSADAYSIFLAAISLIIPYVVAVSFWVKYVTKVYNLLSSQVPHKPQKNL